MDVSPLNVTHSAFYWSQRGKYKNYIVSRYMIQITDDESNTIQQVNLNDDQLSICKLKQLLLLLLNLKRRVFAL